MRRKLRPAPWVALGVLVLVWDVAETRVVGLRGSHEDVFVAVRGVVPEGTVVQGIRFYSNDATVFPEVLLASDGGLFRLPRAGAALRRVALVVGGPGYITVEFAPYEVTAAEHLWAIVRFPDRSPMRAGGRGGGPAIGWREDRQLEGERSLFSVMGAVNEFSPAFDISLVTSESGLETMGKAAPSLPAAASASLAVRPSTRSPGGGVLFRLTVPRAGHMTVDVYSISGRRVRKLVDGDVDPGERDVRWDGLDGDGRSVANGIYLYRVQVDGERSTGKVVLWR
jgi:hypothetical protein